MSSIPEDVFSMPFRSSASLSSLEELRGEQLSEAFHSLFRVRELEYEQLRRTGGGDLRPLDASVLERVLDLVRALNDYKTAEQETKRQRVLYQLMLDVSGLANGILKPEHAIYAYSPDVFIWAQSLADPRSRQKDFIEILRQLLQSDGGLGGSCWQQLCDNPVFQTRVDRAQLGTKALVFLDAVNNLGRCLQLSSCSQEIELRFCAFDEAYTDLFDALIGLRREAIFLQGKAISKSLEAFPWHGLRV